MVEKFWRSVPDIQFDLNLQVSKHYLCLSPVSKVHNHTTAFTHILFIQISVATDSKIRHILTELGSVLFGLLIF